MVLEDAAVSLPKPCTGLDGVTFTGHRSAAPLVHHIKTINLMHLGAGSPDGAPSSQAPPPPHTSAQPQTNTNIHSLLGPNILSQITLVYNGGQKVPELHK